MIEIFYDYFTKVDTYEINKRKYNKKIINTTIPTLNRLQKSLHNISHSLLRL